MKKLLLLTTVLGSMYADPIKYLSPNILNVAGGYRISSTGYYVLTDDVIFSNLAAATNGITITSSSVVLDLNGRVLQGAGGATQVGILVGMASANNPFTNITIRNGTIQNWSGGGILFGNGNRAADIICDGLSLLNNTGTHVAINAGGTNRIVLRNCNLSGSLADGLNITHAGNIRIDNCKFDNNGSTGMTITTATSIMINNSSIGTNIAEGCRIVTCTSVMFTNCVLARNGSDGINTQSSSSLIITDCVANGNGGSGLNFVNTSFSYVGRCLLESNSFMGVSLNSNARTVVIQNCSALGNTGTGFVNNSANALIMGSLATRNTVTNYAGTGPAAVVSFVNGSAIAVGTVFDTTVNNVAIV
jgi:hypothetical protein